MTVEGMHVKVVDPNTRKNCLSGYTFLLGSAHMVMLYVFISNYVFSFSHFLRVAGQSFDEQVLK